MDRKLESQANGLSSARISRRRLLGAGGVLAGAAVLGYSAPGVAASGAKLPPITVRQPLRYEIVDDPVHVCGIGTGFEGMIAARVRDATGRQLARVSIRAGGTGILGNFHALLTIGHVPSTYQGTLEVFEPSPRGNGAELNKVVVPITFGRKLLNPYHGFLQYTVRSEDTLSSIARRFYGDGSKWRRIFEANRDWISNPNIIYTGQTLRIPQ